MFIRPVNVPYADGLLEELGSNVGESGFLTSMQAAQTRTAGVSAAGNVVDPRFQVITCAGAGSATAIAINADLVQDDVGRQAKAASSHGSPSTGPQASRAHDDKVG